MTLRMFLGKKNNNNFLKTTDHLYNIPTIVFIYKQLKISLKFECLIITKWKEVFSLGSMGSMCGFFLISQTNVLNSTGDTRTIGET